METVVSVLAILLSLSNILLVCFLNYSLKGNTRLVERERNVHNAQVSELLDRLAWKEDKPYGLPPRPPAAKEEPSDDELQNHMWREV